MGYLVVIVFILSANIRFPDLGTEDNIRNEAIGKALVRTAIHIRGLPSLTASARSLHRLLIFITKPEDDSEFP